MQQKDISWGNFELYNLDKTHSFENLCRLLFKHELCPDGTILVSEPNHAGVEVKPVLSKDGKVISFQSKYFTGKVQYSQIKKSAEETVKKYNHSLDIWYLYTNRSLSECPSYNDIVKILKDNGTEITVISNDEILTTILKYQYIMEAFFSVNYLPFSWFENQVKSAIDDLGIRYNAAFNVETEALDHLNLFLGNEDGVKYVNSKKAMVLKSIEEHCDKLGYGDRANYDYIETVYGLVTNLEDVDVTNYQKALSWYDDVNEKVSSTYDIESQIEELQEETINDDSRKYLRELEWEKNITENLIFRDEEIDLINNSFVIVSGKAGMGKSQLLAMEALGDVNNGFETILLLGEYFIETSPVSAQIMSKLGLNYDIRKLFSLMEVYGQIKNRPIVVFIDAINECEYQKIWKNGVYALYDLVKEYSFVRVVLSYRSGYEKALFSDGMNNRMKSGEIATIIHRGFRGRLTEATKAFFNYYDVRFSPVYIMQERMQNPLFLSIFCKTYKESNRCLSFPKVFEQFIKHGNKEVKEIMGIDLDGDILFDFLKRIVGKSIDLKERYLDKKTILRLDFWSEYGIDNQKLKFMSAVVKSGVLNDFPKSGEMFYDLGYDLLRDYMYALEILARNPEPDLLYKYIENDLLCIKDGAIHNYGNKSIYISLLAMLDEKENKKILGIIDDLKDGYDKDELIDEYISSFSWRDNSKVSTDYIYELVDKYSISVDTFIDMILENSLRVDSKLNAYYMHEMFENMKLNVRDREWTIFINGLFDESNRLYQLIDLLEHDLQSCRELLDNECELALLLFGWILSASNRNLRDHTSKVIYNILYTFPNKISWFVEKFAHVNDYYIVERVYCICLGVISKITDIKINKEVALVVYASVFSNKEVIQDAKVREFAYLMIVKCIKFVGSIEGIDIIQIKPPYNSEDIPIMEKQNYKSDDYGSGFNRVVSSMYPDKIPNRGHMYGDFGRYIFETCLDYFESVNIENCYHYAMQYIRDELGYEDEYFSDYDGRGFHLNYYPGQFLNIERIGKKYQWIALSNTIARISDNHHIRKYDSDREEYNEFNGLWELSHLRDFDPTIFGYHTTDIDLPKFDDIEIDYSCKDDSDETAELWARNKGDFFETCTNALAVKDKSGCTWVRLYTSESLSNKKKSLRRGRYSSERGDLYSWFQSEAFFAKNADREKLFTNIKQTNFWGQWFPKGNSEYRIMLGEYPWSPAIKDRRLYEWQRAYPVDEIAHSRELSKIDVMNATIHSLRESEYDASIEGTYSELLPCIKLFDHFNLIEDKKNGCFFDRDGDLVAINDSLFDNGEGFLIKADKLQKFLEDNDFCLFWILLGGHNFHCGEGTDRQICSEWSGYATFYKGIVNSKLYDMTPVGHRY